MSHAPSMTTTSFAKCFPPHREHVGSPEKPRRVDGGLFLARNAHDAALLSDKELVDARLAPECAWQWRRQRRRRRRETQNTECIGYFGSELNAAAAPRSMPVSMPVSSKWCVFEVCRGGACSKSASPRSPSGTMPSMPPRRAPPTGSTPSASAAGRCWSTCVRDVSAAPRVQKQTLLLKARLVLRVQTDGGWL